VPATIAHVHPISRAENRALVKLLSIQMLHVSEPRELERFAQISIVDASAPESSIELPPGLKVFSVVDHHRSQLEIDAPYVDIRPEIGATATIYSEYVEALAPLTQEARDDIRVATTLLFGIQTDTDDFTLAASADFRAAAYLKPFCDTAVLGRVGHRTLPAESMDVLGRALSELEVMRDFAIVGVGIVSPAQRDAIPTAADFILRRDDIETVLVYGLVGDRIDGSLRTNSPSIDPALFLETALGTDSRGRPYGGGRADKGGFQIPLGILADVDDPGTLWEMVKQMVRRRFARVIPGLDRVASH
jgi:nanoRNase/pAp phosphatase (c-di-AMP/oligoRNAs hydrolase)